MAGPTSPQDDYQGEKTLLTARPTRYIAFHYYVLFLIALVLVPLVYFGTFFFDRIPKVTIGPINTNLILMGVLLLIALYALLRAELKRATTQYIITDNKVIRRDGILRKDTQMVPFTQLERVDLNQSLGQRILHIGTVVIDTGDDTLRIDHISHPEHVQELLSERIGRRAYVTQR